MVTLPVWGHYSTKEINLWLGKSYRISRCDSLLYKNTLSERKPVVQKVLFWPFNGKSAKVSKKKEKSLISIFFDLFYADIPLVFVWFCLLIFFFPHLWGGTSLLMAFTFRSYMEFTIAYVFFLFSSLFYFPNLVPFFSFIALPPQLFGQAWLQWRELYLYSQNDKQKETRAVTHHRHWELKRCMEAWLGYLNLHREKKLQNGEWKWCVRAEHGSAPLLRAQWFFFFFFLYSERL